MSLSIKNRIYLSFAVLVMLFIVNGAISIVVLNKNKKLSDHITWVVDPSFDAIYDFRKMMVQSTMYITNWIFLRSNDDDKDALIKIQKAEFLTLQVRFEALLRQWKDQSKADSLRSVISTFKAFSERQKGIMAALNTFSDYDDPQVKWEAERKLEDEVLPLSQEMINGLEKVIIYKTFERSQIKEMLQKSSDELRVLILSLAVIILLFGIFLSIYMTKIITAPIQRINRVIRDIARGIIKPMDLRNKKDEIGEMMVSINMLSENLKAKVLFAREIGKRNFDSSYFPASDDDMLDMALLTMRDNLRTGDEELFKTQHQMQTFLNNIDEVFFSVDMIENKILLISPACTKVFGYNEAEFTKYPDLWYKLIFSEDLQGIDEKLSTMQAGTAITIAYRIVTPDGTHKWLETKISPTINEKGILIRIDGVSADITFRKMAEEEANTLTQKLQTSVKETADYRSALDQSLIVSITDHKGIITYANENLSNISKFSIDEIIGRDHRMFNSGHHSKEFMKDLWRTIANGKVWHGEVKNMAKDGTFYWVNATIVPFINEDGKPYQYLAIRADITERKNADEELKVKNSELSKTNAELDKFVYSVSHDLRAPLSSMLGVVEISEEETTEPLLLEHLGMLKGSIKRLDGFIMDILNYSRNSRVEIKKEEIQFDEILKEITNNLKNMNSSNDRQVEIKFEINNQVSFISDNSRINILLSNLISNAIRYQNPATNNPLVDIQINMSDTETDIIVKDNGIGITKEHQEKIFEMFYRVSEKSVGSGLGLYLVKEIVDKLEGKIEIESEVGKGTAFCINLPNNTII